MNRPLPPAVRAAVENPDATSQEGDRPLDPVEQFAAWDLLDRTAEHDVPTELLETVTTPDQAAGWWAVFHRPSTTRTPHED